MQGLFGAVWGTAGLIGPLLGGFITTALSWRWVFFINIPFGIGSIALLVAALHEHVPRKPHELDLAGAALLSGAIVALLGAGGDTWAMTLPLAIVMLLAFLWTERRAREPLLEIELFSRPVMAVSSIANTLVGGAMLAMVTYVPLFVQGLLGRSPTEAGAAITPMVIGWPIASALSGRLLPRVGFRPLVRVGFVIAAGAAVALPLALEKVGLDPGAGKLGTTRAVVGLFGVGLGCANTALLIGVQTSVEWQQRGVATASTMFFRSMGGALTVGGLGRLLSHALEGNGSLSPDVANALLGPDHGKGLPAETLRTISASLRSSLDAIFWIIAVLAVCSLIVSWFFPDVRSRESRAGD
jgi:MFS family permease